MSDDPLIGQQISHYLVVAKLGGADASKARTAYQDFLAARKDADPAVPILVAAKQEYARLR